MNCTRPELATIITPIKKAFLVREIEEGITPVRTRLLEDQNEIIKELKRLNNNDNKLSICSGFGGMQMSSNFLCDSYKRTVDMYRNGKLMG